LIKKSHHTQAHTMGAGIDSRLMALYFGMSLFIHLIFIGSAVFLPEYKPRPQLGQGSINVSLVSLPGPPAAAPAPAPAPAAAPEPTPAPTAKAVALPQKEIEKTPPTPVPQPPPAQPEPAKTVSLAPQPEKPRVKKSLKKQTQNRQKMIDRALSKVQKDVEESQSDSVRKALDRLKKKVAQGGAAALPPSQTAKDAGAAAGTGVAGGTGSGGRRELEISDLYKIEVAFQVERNWAFSQQVVGDGQTMQASLVFNVLPSGEITDIRFTQRSGNSYLDESAYKAIVKANPVSPHPDGLRLPYVTVALRFTPEGLRK
jgi:colicin import membrane protein